MNNIIINIRHLKITFYVRSILLCAFFFYAQILTAQEKKDSLSTAESKKSTTNIKSRYRKEEVKTIPFNERWALSTNAVDWILTVPNVRVEFDLTNSVYNKYVIGIEGKYNWNTRHTYTPNWTFNLWEVRPELRRYWHTDLRQDKSKMSLRDRFFSRERKKPRMWRGYYAGVYATATGYGLKFGKEGKQGTAYGIGISGGFSIPLYSFKKNLIDIEFGGSIGFYMTQYDTYVLDRNINAYVPVDAKTKSMHLVPYPIINDLRVSFVYRFNNSIKNKYKKIDHVRLQEKQAKANAKKARRDSIKQANYIADSLKTIRKRFVKDSIRIAEHREDSIRELNIKLKGDSLSLNKETNNNTKVSKEKNTAATKEEKLSKKKEAEVKEDKPKKRNRLFGRKSKEKESEKNRNKEKATLTTNKKEE